MVPDDAPEMPLLCGTQRWYYHNAEGCLSFAVDRYDPRRDNDHKQFVPLTLWRNDAGTLAWHKKHPPQPRPLYGRDRLAQSPGAPVLVLEGEKSADAAAKLLPGFAAITSSGGAGAANTADWSPLEGRIVVIWPDNDEPGSRYAEQVARLALAAGALSVRIITVPAGWPESWDLADSLPEDVTVERLREMIVAAEPATSGIPDMSIVQRTALPAPILDLNMFGPIATWIKQAAESKSAPTDYIAWALLGSAAGIIGAARWVSPWPEWREPAIFWAMLVGSPSASKSPGMDAARDPLTEVEREAAATWPETRRAYETAKAIAAARYEEWSLAVGAAVKAGKPEPLMPAEAESPPEPQMPRVVITDATIEATATILSAILAGWCCGGTNAQRGSATSASTETATAHSGSKPMVVGPTS